MTTITTVQTGDVTTGQAVTLTLTLNGPATVDTSGGSPSLTLSDGATATYDAAASNPSAGTLVFDYTVAAADYAVGLSATAVNLNGAVVTDGGGTAIDFSTAVPAPLALDVNAAVVTSVAASQQGEVGPGQAITLTLAMNEAVTVDTTGGSPSLALNDGATATYDAAASNPAAGRLVFDYTVGTGEETLNLEVTQVNLNGAAVADTSGRAADLAGALFAPTNLQVGPAVVNSVTTSATGDADTGQTVTLTLAMSGPVTVNTAGGSPTLKLNDGATATYDAAASNPGAGTLVFDYAVGATDATPDLTVRQVNLNGATILDGANLAPDFSAALNQPSGLTVNSPLALSTFAFTTVNDPSAAQGTFATGINVAGEIVGNYVDAGNISHGYVESAGGFTTIDDPLATGGTFATGINASGQVVGYYFDSNNVVRGFLDNAGSFTTLNDPLATGGTDVFGVNDSGQMVGTYFDNAGSHSFLFSNGTYTTLSDPSATNGTVVSGINDAGEVVGSYSDNTGTHGFLFSNGTYTTLNDPSATASTSASGINSAGEIVGAYTDKSGSHAFLYSNGVYTNLNDPSSGRFTSASGINDAGEIIGTYDDASGVAHGFAAVSAPAITASPGTGLANVGQLVTITLNMTRPAIVAGGTPVLTLNNGGTASYDAAATAALGDPTKLVFDYTVAQSDGNTPALAVTGVALNGATVQDASGNNADFAAAHLTFSGLQIDPGPPVTTPTITAIGETPATGDLGIGNTVALTLTTSEAVTVTGTPTLTLNDGGTATYDAAKSTATALVFDYTVAATDTNVAALAVATINLTGGATIKNGGGNDASLSLTGLSQLGPQIDATVPAFTAVSQTPPSGDLGIGKTVALTLATSEAVTVTGTPTLTLNDGGIAIYDAAKSTATALVFDYTVAATETNVAALNIAGVTLAGGATIKDGGGNDASLSLTGLTQLGPQIDATVPAFTAVSETPATGDLGIGKTVALTLSTSEAVTVTGTPTLALNDGGTATYDAAKSTATALVFDYTVAATDTSVAALAVAGVTLAGGATIRDGGGNDASLSLTGLSQLGPQIDATVPAFTAVSETPPSGDLGVGQTVALTLATSEAVTVTGTPTLSLNDGGTAIYDAAKSTATALVFDYTVAATDTNVAALDIASVNLTGGATIKDGGGNDASLSLAGLTQLGPQIDATAPKLTAIAETPTSGVLGIGQTVALTLTTSEAVTVTGTPTLALNDGGTATFDAAKSTATALVFDYTVTAGQNTTDLQALSLDLPSGAAIRDGGGNALDPSLGSLAQLGPQIVTSGPVLTAISDTPATGDFGAGKRIFLTLAVSEPVRVRGTPTLTLNDGGTATYDRARSTSTALVFDYTVAAGQNTAALMVNSLNLPRGASIRDGSGNALNPSLAGLTQAGPEIDTIAPTVLSVAAHPADADLNAGKTVTLTVDFSEAVTVNTAGGVPFLRLNDGGRAIYAGGSGTSALTFVYTVAPGQNTPDLAARGLSLNGGTIRDGAGNNAVLSGAATSLPGVIEIDTRPPTISSVTASGAGISNGNGDLDVGKTVTLTVAFSEAVAVDTTNGLPALRLNDGGIATYAGGSGTNALTFTYAVAAGQNTPDLAVRSLALNGATIEDLAGNNAILTGAARNPPGILQIDTTAPTVTNVTALPGRGIVTTGHIVTIALDMSEPVTVTGTPVLLLNDGGTARYDAARSTSQTMVFDYTATAGQVTTDLVIAGIRLPSVSSITDLAGNDAVLSGAGANLGLRVNTASRGPAGPSGGAFTIGGSREIELFGASTASVTFAPGDTGTLKLDASTQFHGTVAGLALGNHLDLADIAFGASTTLGYASNAGNTGGTLTVRDGTHTASLALLGQYMAASFVMSSDGHGGTSIVDPPLVSAFTPVVGQAHHA